MSQLTAGDALSLPVTSLMEPIREMELQFLTMLRSSTALNTTLSRQLLDLMEQT